MKDALETYEYRGLRIEVHAGGDPESPREWGNAGTMACWHRRYDLGDEQPKEDPEEYLARLVDAYDQDLSERVDRARDHFWKRAGWESRIERVYEKRQASALENYVMLPLYLYDHSGITMSTGSFSCPWDSGQVGFIYITMEKAREEWGEKHNPGISDEEIRKKAIACLESEVKVYDDYLTGSVYGYVVASDDGDHIDSCWGYFGSDEARWHDDYDKCGYMMQCARDAADAHLKHSEEMDTQLCMNI